VWNEMEGKFKKELVKLEKTSPINKMQLREINGNAKNRSFM
jgi:hypothetical protein